MTTGDPFLSRVETAEPNGRTLECPACGAPGAGKTVYWKWGYPIRRCTGCGLGSTGLDSHFDPRGIYGERYFTGEQRDGYADYLATEPVLRDEFRQSLNALRAAGRVSGRLFEIGCAYGFFLSEAQQHFDVSGVEICPEAAAFARARGLEVATGIFTEDLIAPRKPVDAVVMLDVIEHLTDPLGVLQTAHRNMRPGGHLLLTTGDWDSALSRLMGRAWRLMTPPQHVYFFSRCTIDRILRRAGFRVLSFARPSKRVPASLMLFQLARIAGFSSKPDSRFSRLAIPVNLFDAMRVVAVRE